MRVVKLHTPSNRVPVYKDAAFMQRLEELFLESHNRRVGNKKASVVAEALKK